MGSRTLKRHEKVGLRRDIMLVAHSYGGFYSELYAFRHPNHVKAVVLIDANHVVFTSRLHSKDGS